MPKTTKTAKKQTKNDDYSIVILANDTEYRANGETILSALDQIKPVIIKTKSIVTITKGNQKLQKMFFPFSMRRLLTSKIKKQIFEKQLSPYFK
jgi:hypothetical protein